MTSESAIQSQVRLAAANQGLLLYRNNTGVAYNENGQPIRFGLANDSKQLNEHVKSSDLIGLCPVVITPAWLGYTVGVFTALETKRSDWRFQPGDKRAVAQLAFHDIVRQAGGFAGFVQSPEDMMRVIGRAMP